MSCVAALRRSLLRVSAAWHNTAAAAVREPLDVGAFAEQVPSVVGVRANGKAAATVRIDPRSSVLSGAAWGHFEISPCVRASPTGGALEVRR